MLKGHMSFLYVNFKKFPTNQFVGNFCPFLWHSCTLYLSINELFYVI
jgi:hypothetical protein